MIFLRRAAHLPIGIDIGHGSIKLLQLREQSGALSVQASASHLFGGEPPLAGVDRVARAMPLIRTLIQQNDFYGRSVVAVMPREYVTVKTIRVPVLADAELQSAIHMEARELFTLSPDKLSIRFIPAGEVKQGAEARLEVIVLAVETRLIDELLEMYNQIDLIVDSIDFEPCAMYRGIERFVRRKEDENEVNVLVDIGAHKSQVVIGRGREITFSKTIDIGGSSLNECVSRKLGLSLDEAASLRRRFASVDPTERDPVRQSVADATRASMSDLAHEVSLCLRYYSVTFRGQRPPKVRLLGGEANDPLLRQVLAAALTVPIEVYRPLAGVDGGLLTNGDDETLGEWGVSFGAALRRQNGAVVRRASEQSPGFGRRKSDSSVVEVVDITKAVKTAAGPETSEGRGRRSEEVARA